VSGFASTLLKPKWLRHFGIDWQLRAFFRVFARALSKKPRDVVGILFFDSDPDRFGAFMRL
jgi:hypothetical protein